MNRRTIDRLLLTSRMRAGASKCMLIFKLSIALLFFSPMGTYGQLNDPLKDVKLTGHPRLLTDDQNGKRELARLIKDEPWAGETFKRIKDEVDIYLKRCETDSNWMVSRLQMYWQDHFTQVFIKNGAYAYATGRAPVPTVRFTGTRDAATQYLRPSLQDIKPFMDDAGKLFLQNKALPGTPWEWVEQSKTGRIIEAINIEIMEKARNASMLYWYTGDEIYARFAYAILDTYLTGMYYRTEPVDLNNGHDQTLVGLSSFEVIHEDIVEPLTACYDFLEPYIRRKAPEKQNIYTSTLKKWADIIIKNGVPFNNWDLIEARFVARIALVLENDDQYTDVRGAQYYLNQILNKTYTRQWALTDLLKKGYDPVTAIWNECPGYSINVLADFTGFINLFDRTLRADFLPAMPVIPKAVLNQAQYLFPNGYTVGFGDTHYSRLRNESIEDLIRNARLHGKAEQEALYTRLYKTIKGMEKESATGEKTVKASDINSLFGNPPLTLSSKISAGKPEDYMTPTFWSPNVSWLVQRNGTDKRNGLMISQAGSTGNHAHANGIAMELYGKGIIMAPEGGIGGSYFQADYAEYYSQFPAHNTVVVDGISSYPTMKSNHGLKLKALYPLSGQKTGFFKGVTFSDVSFLEPETNADQNRLMSIVKTSDSTGYYVDIFRSRRKDGGDKYHDYIYHNLGQELLISDLAGRMADLKPTEKLTFANEELMGYDYWYDKRSFITQNDFKAVFKLSFPGRDTLKMNMWMSGAPGREVFSVKAPPSRSWRTNEIIPDSIAKAPLPTLIVRQLGEAWDHPFTAIYEPSEGSDRIIAEVKGIKAAKADPSFSGLFVQHKNGFNDIILSGSEGGVSAADEFVFKGTYAVIRQRDQVLSYLFLGNGNSIESSGYAIESGTPISAGFEIKDNKLFFFANGRARLLIRDTFKRNSIITLKLGAAGPSLAGKKVQRRGKHYIAFQMPPLGITQVFIR